MAAWNEGDDVVGAIARELGEHEPIPLQYLRDIVAGLGPIRVARFVEAAKILHELGGLVRMKSLFKKEKAATRSLGGTFFFLVSQHIDGRLIIKPRRAVPHHRAPAGAAYPTITWSERGKIAPSEKGEASTVKITVIGRPGQVTRANGFVAVVMSQRKVPSLPRGLPSPPPTPTDYLVFINEKQWKKVEPAIAAPDDILIVEGWCAFDGETEKIAVWATNTTTRALQNAKRTATPA